MEILENIVTYSHNEAIYFNKSSKSTPLKYELKKRILIVKTHQAFAKNATLSVPGLSLRDCYIS